MVAKSKTKSLHDLNARALYKPLLGCWNHFSLLIAEEPTVQPGKESTHKMVWEKQTIESNYQLRMTFLNLATWKDLFKMQSKLPQTDLMMRMSRKKMMMMLLVCLPSTCSTVFICQNKKQRGREKRKKQGGWARLALLSWKEGLMYIQKLFSVIRLA